MNRLRNIRLTAVVAIMGILPFCSTPTPSLACTGICLTATDGTTVYARTLEFATNLESNIIVVPRGYERVGATPDGKEGLKWTAKYATVGANGMGQPYLFDGVNEKGLAGGLFYFPGSAVYPSYDAAKAKKTLAAWQLNSWILENFATVEDVKTGLEKIVVPAELFKPMGLVLPVHFVVHDASGKCIVIEPVGGKLVVHDNPLGTITNAPVFDWHITNLRNYVNLSATNDGSSRLGPLTLQPFGEGSGMLGLPGDFTPPSRFVRAAFFSQSQYRTETGRETVLQAFHILNNFDIPKGAVRNQEKDARGNPPADYTQWTAASDLGTKCYYFKTYENNRIRMIPLMKMELGAKEIKTISMQGKEEVEILGVAD